MPARLRNIELDAVYFAGPAPWLLGQRVCVMGGSTQHVDKVKLTNGGVVINLKGLKGLHIGSLMFGRIVDWAKQFPGHWCIVPIGLAAIDAREPEAKQRRNQFYENFGIRFGYDSADGRFIVSLPGTVRSRHLVVCGRNDSGAPSAQMLCAPGTMNKTTPEPGSRFHTICRDAQGCLQCPQLPGTALPQYFSRNAKLSQVLHSAQRIGCRHAAVYWASISAWSR